MDPLKALLLASCYCLLMASLTVLFLQTNHSNFLGPHEFEFFREESVHAAAIARAVLNNKTSAVPGEEFSSNSKRTNIKTKQHTTKFDPKYVTHVYHLGHEAPEGGTNNHIIAILRAVDLILDKHTTTTDITAATPKHDPAAAPEKRCRAVVAISNWAFDLLKHIFYNNDVGGGEENDKNKAADDKEFALMLEELNPVLLIHQDRLDTLGLLHTDQHIKHVYLHFNDAFYYTSKDHHTAELIESNRRLVWGQLFQHFGIAKQNLILYNATLRDVINKKKQLSKEPTKKDDDLMKYVTIHSRWLDGECEWRVGNRLPARDECWMTPTYIKQILGDKIDTPIVFIGDGQNEMVLKNLQEDPDISPALIVANDVVLSDADQAVVDSTQPLSDMMLGIMGDAFIGTRVSTFANVVGTSRVVGRGADPSTNYIFTSINHDDDGQQQQHQRQDVGVGVAEVCEGCLFLCDKKRSHLCGEKNGPYPPFLKRTITRQGEATYW